MKRISFFSLAILLFMLLSFFPAQTGEASTGQVPPAFTAIDGNWSGTIDRGNVMSFSVSSGGT